MFIKDNIRNEWKEIELGSNDFNMNHTIISILKPSEIVAPFSYGMNIPRTRKNSIIFEYKYRLDNLNNGSDLYEFIIIDDIFVPITGTCYIDSIDNENYNLVLNGSMTGVLNTLLNTSNSDFYNRLQTEINPTLIKSNFEYNVENYIWNFATFNRLFPQNSILNNIGGFLPVSNQVPVDFEPDKLVYNNLIGSLPEEMVSQQMAEFRDWSLRPYVYVHRLWQIVQSKCKELTGYDMILDNRWFNQTNNHLNKLVYVLNDLDTSNVSETNQTSVSKDVQFQVGSQFSTYTNTIEGEEITVSGDNRAVFEFDIPFSFEVENSSNKMMFNPKYYIKANVKIQNDSQVYVNKNIIYYFVPKWTETGDTVFENVPTLVKDYLESLGDELVIVEYGLPKLNKILNIGSLYHREVLQNVQNAKLQVNISVGTQPYDYPNILYRILTDCPVVFTDSNFNLAGDLEYNYGNSGGISSIDYVGPDIPVGVNGEDLIDTTMLLLNKSNSKLNIDRFFGGENMFSICLKYCKLANLTVIVDDVNKTIKFINIGDLLEDAKTDIVQRTLSNNINVDNMNIELSPWSSRYFEFNFDDSEIEELDDYESDISYGGLKVDTNLVKNNDVEELFEDIKPAVIVASYIRPYNSYSQDVDYRVQDDNYLANESGCFVFRMQNGVYDSDTRDGLRVDDGGAYVLITSDLQVENNNQIYCYHRSEYGNDVKTHSRPVFSVNNNNAIIYFGKPTVMFDREEGSSLQGTTLFDRYWKDTMVSVYGNGNKCIKTECVLNLSLYTSIKNKPIIMIGNTLWIVAEISNYSPGKNCSLTCLQLLETPLQRNISGILGGVTRA